MVLDGRDVRKISADIYHRIRDEGLLSRARFRIYECLYLHGPMTASECFAVLAKEVPRLNWNTRTRFGELRDQGVVYEVRERPCRVTGELVIEWGVTNRLPVPLRREAKTPTRAEIAQAIEAIEKEYEDDPPPEVVERVLGWMKRRFPRRSIVRGGLRQ